MITADLSALRSGFIVILPVTFGLVAPVAISGILLSCATGAASSVFDEATSPSKATTRCFLI
jgi:hypothetical protein